MREGLRESRRKTLLLVRTGVIAAIYVALTYALMSVAYGPVQIRNSKKAFGVQPKAFYSILTNLYPTRVNGCALGYRLRKVEGLHTIIVRVPTAE